MIRKILKVGLTLMVYCLVSALVLAIVQAKTAAKISAQNSEKKFRAMKSVLPEADNFVEKKVEAGFVYFVGFKGADTSNPTGYIVETSSRGYSSDIVTLVGIDTTFRIVNIKILSQAETPGLGTKAVEGPKGKLPPFQAQFSGLTADEVLLRKDGGKINSLTGATITSRAIARSCRNAILSLREALARESKINN